MLILIEFGLGSCWIFFFKFLSQRIAELSTTIAWGRVILARWVYLFCFVFFMGKHNKISRWWEKWERILLSWWNGQCSSSVTAGSVWQGEHRAPLAAQGLWARQKGHLPETRHVVVWQWDTVTVLKPANLLEIYSHMEQTFQHSCALMPRFRAAHAVLSALTNKHNVLMLMLKKCMVLKSERLEVQREHPFTTRIWYFHPVTWAYLILIFPGSSSWILLWKKQCWDHG